MLPGGSTGRGGVGLFRHWTKAKNERVDVLEPRGICAESLREQIERLTALSAHSRIRAPIFHFWFPPNPRDRKPTQAELDELLDRMETEFGLNDTPRIGVQHTLPRDLETAGKAALWDKPIDEVLQVCIARHRSMV